MKRLCAILLVALLLAALIPSASFAATQYAYVIGGWLRLRESPSFSAATLASYYTGTRVEILSATGSWYRVRTPDSLTGYMYSDYLTFNVPSPDVDEGTAVVVSDNGYGVRLRSGPGTGYQILGVFNTGTVATVLQRGTTWSRLRINSIVGYMMNRYLNFGGGGGGGGGGDEPVIGTATIWSSNGKGVRLRTGPGTNYAIIGVYSVGTRADVLQHGVNWTRIRIGSRTGYMATRFLRTYSSTEVSAVSINSTQPMIGDTLQVTGITPANAIVDYSWVVNGVEVSASSSLWLNPADTRFANNPITLFVSGRDGFTGSASVTTAPVLTGKLGFEVRLNNTNPALGDKLIVLANDANPNATFNCVWTIDGVAVYTGSTYYVPSDLRYAGKTVTAVVTGTGIYGTATSTNGFDAMISPSGSGYLSNLYIYNISLGSIPATNVNVGQTLQAAVSPDTDQVSYEWCLMDATTNTVIRSLGKTATIVVPTDAAMLNRKLLACAVGKGYYAGAATLYAEVSYVSNDQRVTSVSITPSTGLTYQASAVGGTAVATTLTANVVATQTVTNPAAYYNYQWYRGNIIGTWSAIPGAIGSAYTVTQDDVGCYMAVGVTPLQTGWLPTEVIGYTNDYVKAPLISGQMISSSGSTSIVNVGETVSIALNPAGTNVQAVRWYVNNNYRGTGNAYTVTLADANVNVQTVLTAEVTAAMPYTGSWKGTMRINPNPGGTMRIEEEAPSDAPSLIDENGNLNIDLITDEVINDPTNNGDSENNSTGVSVPTGIHANDNSSQNDDATPVDDIVLPDNSFVTFPVGDDSAVNFSGEDFGVSFGAPTDNGSTTIADQVTLALSEGADTIWTMLDSTVYDVALLKPDYLWEIDGERLSHKDSYYALNAGDIGRKIVVTLTFSDGSTLRKSIVAGAQ